MVNLKLLGELREAWVNNRNRIEGHIEMDAFFTRNGVEVGNYDCDTDCCLAGWGAVLLPNRVDSREGAQEFSNVVTSDNDMWRFLFSRFWPNSYDHALARMDYVLEHGEPPVIWDYNWQPEPKTND